MGRPTPPTCKTRNRPHPRQGADAPTLPELLDQIPPEQEIATVTAFDIRKCYDAIAARGAAAIIPPRKNANPGSPTPPGRPHAKRSFGHRSTSDRPSGDDGAGITDEAAQRARCTASSCWVSTCQLGTSNVKLPEFQVPVSALNDFTAPGTPIAEGTGKVCSGQGAFRLSADLCTGTALP